MVVQDVFVHDRSKLKLNIFVHQCFIPLIMMEWHRMIALKGR